MRAKFLADANFDLVILVAAKRRELAFDYQTALEAGLTGQQDSGVLAIAAREGHVLLTHDVRTMPQHCLDRNGSGRMDQSHHELPVIGQVGGVAP